MTIVLTIKCFRLKAMLDVVPASNSQYPTSDYLLDNIVMVCFCHFVPDIPLRLFWVV